MHVDSDYVHALEGRLRIKIPQVKGSAGKAQEIEAYLQQLSGVESVFANPTTGNVLIHYHSRLANQWEIIAELKEAGYLSAAALPGDRSGGAASSQGVVEKVTASVAASLMEVALSQLLSALI